MGPVIILDKSAVQGLSAEEELMLSKHYSVVVPPILPVEILADLKKPANESSLSQRDVQIVAANLRN